MEYTPLLCKTPILAPYSIPVFLCGMRNEEDLSQRRRMKSSQSEDKEEKAETVLLNLLSIGICIKNHTVKNKEYT